MCKKQEIIIKGKKHKSKTEWSDTMKRDKSTSRTNYRITQGHKKNKTELVTWHSYSKHTKNWYNGYDSYQGSHKDR